MGVVPSSQSPGLKALHIRAKAALDRCQESQAVDFKKSEPWEKLKWKIIRTVIGMGNLRDGGIIIIGISQESDTWKLTGILKKHLRTYDVDKMVGEMDAYISPSVSLDIATVEYTDGKTYLAIQVHEFFETPFVCKKNGPREEKDLIEGVFLIRPPGVPRTTRVTTAEEMHDLLELAAEKRARKLLETARRIGLGPLPSSKDRFDEELEGL